MTFRAFFYLMHSSCTLWT